MSSYQLTAPAMRPWGLLRGLVILGAVIVLDPLGRANHRPVGEKLFVSPLRKSRPGRTLFMFGHAR